MSDSTENTHQNTYANASFADKVAIVTGGSQGLGAATARLMDQRGVAGLVLVGRDNERGQAVVDSLACPALFLSVDIGDADAADNIVAAADAEYGRVDCVVNAAASTWRGSVWDTDAAMWDEMLAVNTRAPAMMITAAAKVMKRGGHGGSIVNIGSVVAHGGPDFLYPYAASKAALQAITRNAAYALMRHRIRVNLLQPGWMDTEGEDVTQRKFHGAQDDWREQAAPNLAFGRLIDPNELARSICHLASDESGMMTGATIDFDQTVVGAGDAPRPNLAPAWGEEGE